MLPWKWPHVWVGSFSFKAVIMSTFAAFNESLHCQENSSQGSYWNCACENSQPVTCGSHGSPSGTCTATSLYQLLDHHVQYLDRGSSIDTEALWEKPDCMTWHSFPTILRTITDTVIPNIPFVHEAHCPWVTVISGSPHKHSVPFNFLCYYVNGFDTSKRIGNVKIFYMLPNIICFSIYDPLKRCSIIYKHHMHTWHKLKSNYMAMLLIVMVQYWQNEQLFLKCLPVCASTLTYSSKMLWEISTKFLSMITISPKLQQ